MKSPKKIQYKKEYYIRTKKQRERYYSNKKEILNKARIYYLQNRSKILKRTKDKYHADEIKFKENKDFRKIYLKRLEDIRIAHERRNRVERKEDLEAFPKIECQKCGWLYVLGYGDEPTTFCHSCAQEIISKLEKITPKPPNAITWENWVEILNLIQKELYER